VTEHVGGTGVVGVLRNGQGPTVLVRTDLDALPIEEKTDLPYASKAPGVMHACGHDVHMISWIGAAALLARSKTIWHGTLVFVGQPAEETLEGANLMINDGLFTRFPKPDFVLGLHDTNFIPAGKVGLVAGPASAASNAVDITFYGKGGHGAAPHRTIDPIVMAAHTVTALQTIVARENNPFDAAVVTVGTFHAGTKRNIIPDEARLELTVRSYKTEVQKHLLKSIERIAKAQAVSAGATKEPTVTVLAQEASEVVVNDPAMVRRLATALQKEMGDAVGPVEPTSGSEDFGVFGRVANVPSVQLRVGASEPSEWAKAKAAGTLPPGPHTANFAPDRERTLRTGVAALTFSTIELLKGPRGAL
jgi:hippurate hydrolase